MKYFKKFIYIVEFVLALTLIAVLLLIGMRASAWLVGRLVRFVGKRHGAHNVAFGNLSRAMPHLSVEEKADLLDKVWLNLGMVFGEFLHIGILSKKKINKIINIDEGAKLMIEKMIAAQKEGRGGIITSAHFGNWEVGLRYMIDKGVRIRALYRPLNNTYVNWLMKKIRTGSNIAKGRDGSREIIQEIKKGSFVVILADQKVTGGLPIKFFHDDALTTESIAKIVTKYDVDLVMAKVTRVGESSNFEFGLENVEVSEYSSSRDVTKLITNKIEDWVRDCPEQWFWVHDRWKK